MRSRCKGLFRALPGSLLIPIFLVWSGLLLSACLPGTAPVETITPTPSLTPTPDYTETPTIVWFPPTKTPTPLPTSDLPQAPEPRLDLGEVLLEDDFSEGILWQTGEFSGGRVALGRNELTLAISEQKTYLTSLRPQPELSNFYLEVDAVPSLCRGADQYGLLLRAAGDTAYYRLVLTCEGRLRLERVRDNTTAVLQDWTPRSSPPDATHLAVWAAGPELRFFINDTFQYSVNDSALTTGSLGVFARSTGDTALTVNFSNLTVWQIQGNAVSPTSQPTETPTP